MRQCFEDEQHQKCNWRLVWSWYTFSCRKVADVVQPKFTFKSVPFSSFFLFLSPPFFFPLASYAVTKKAVFPLFCFLINLTQKIEFKLLFWVKYYDCFNCEIKLHSIISSVMCNFYFSHVLFSDSTCNSCIAALPPEQKLVLICSFPRCIHHIVINAYHFVSSVHVRCPQALPWAHHH